jgi:hypothetical protein
MSRFFQNPNLTPYVPGEQPRGGTLVKLNTNESPFPPVERALYMAAEAGFRAHLYSDPSAKALREALAEKYGVSRTTLERKAKEERWTELRRQADGKAEAKIINAVSEKNAKIDDTYFRCVDKLMKKAEELIDSTPIWQPTNLKDMATTMKYLKECKGVKSEADIREQEARIAKLQKEAQEEDKDNEIKVTIEGDLELYSK